MKKTNNLTNIITAAAMGLSSVSALEAKANQERLSEKECDPAYLTGIQNIQEGLCYDENQGSEEEEVEEEIERRTYMPEDGFILPLSGVFPGGDTPALVYQSSDGTFTAENLRRFDIIPSDEATDYCFSMNNPNTCRNPRSAVPNAQLENLNTDQIIEYFVQSSASERFIEEMGWAQFQTARLVDENSPVTSPEKMGQFLANYQNTQEDLENEDLVRMGGAVAALMYGAEQVDASNSLTQETRQNVWDQYHDTAISILTPTNLFHHNSTGGTRTRPTKENRGIVNQGLEVCLDEENSVYQGNSQPYYGNFENPGSLVQCGFQTMYDLKRGEEE